MGPPLLTYSQVPKSRKVFLPDLLLIDEGAVDGDGPDLFLDELEQLSMYHDQSEATSLLVTNVVDEMFLRQL